MTFIKRNRLIFSSLYLFDIQNSVNWRKTNRTEITVNEKLRS